MHIGLSMKNESVVVKIPKKENSTLESAKQMKYDAAKKDVVTLRWILLIYSKYEWLWANHSVHWLGIIMQVTLLTWLVYEFIYFWLVVATATAAGCWYFLFTGRFLYSGSFRNNVQIETPMMLLPLKLIIIHCYGYVVNEYPVKWFIFLQFFLVKGEKESIWLKQQMYYLVHCLWQRFLYFQKYIGVWKKLF